MGLLDVQDIVVSPVGQVVQDIGRSGSGIVNNTSLKKCGGYGHKSEEFMKEKWGLFKMHETIRPVTVFRRGLCQDCMSITDGPSYDHRKWLE